MHAISVRGRSSNLRAVEWPVPRCHRDRAARLRSTIRSASPSHPCPCPLLQHAVMSRTVPPAPITDSVSEAAASMGKRLVQLRSVNLEMLIRLFIDPDTQSGRWSRRYNCRELVPALFSSSCSDKSSTGSRVVRCIENRDTVRSKRPEQGKSDTPPSARTFDESCRFRY